jgi:RNA polymerase sigma factor (TIGR02999 family)
MEAGTTGRSSSKPTQQLTQLLRAVSDGDPASMERLAEAVYADLRRICANELARTSPAAGHQLLIQPTDLVHDLYLRLIDQNNTTWVNRAHFFAIAARLIRRALVDQIRAAQRLKRGGGRDRGGGLKTCISFDPAEIQGRTGVDALELDDALERLAQIDPVAVRIIEMRIFAGLAERDIAHILEFSDRTLRRHLQFARAWLFRDLRMTT